MRIPDWKPEDLTPAQRKVHDAIVAGPRGRVVGPLRVWIMSPELAERAQELGAFCRYRTSLPPRLSELAILVTGAFWKASFEWHAHAPIAIKAGVPADAVEAIRLGQEPKFAREDERAVYEFSRELWTKRRVSDATYRRTADLLGNETVIELVGILGYYGLISMTINTFEVPLPEGVAEPFT
ncbi:MAG TPA: carboxymuconolactone decarboxylase family protein [Xanthobacteraceae bacterium]|jgi:4-carboxymuconolactone decarboxylase